MKKPFEFKFQHNYGNAIAEESENQDSVIIEILTSDLPELKPHLPFRFIVFQQKQISHADFTGNTLVKGEEILEQVMPVAYDAFMLEASKTV